MARKEIAEAVIAEDAPEIEYVDLTEALAGSPVWPRYRAIRHIQAAQFHEPFKVVDREGRELFGLPGDYVVVGFLDDVWVETAEDFQARFRPCSPNKE